MTCAAPAAAVWHTPGHCRCQCASSSAVSVCECAYQWQWTVRSVLDIIETEWSRCRGRLNDRWVHLCTYITVARDFFRVVSSQPLTRLVFILDVWNSRVSYCRFASQRSEFLIGLKKSTISYGRFHNSSGCYPAKASATIKSTLYQLYLVHYIIVRYRYLLMS